MSEIDPIYMERVRNAYRFEYFFAGLVFAVLSFAIQYPVAESVRFIKSLEAVSWVALALTGLMSLKGLGGFAPTYASTYKQTVMLSEPARKVMWGLFVVGVSALLAAKILDSFL